MRGRGRAAKASGQELVELLPAMEEAAASSISEPRSRAARSPSRTRGGDEPPRLVATLTCGRFASAAPAPSSRSRRRRSRPRARSRASTRRSPKFVDHAGARRRRSTTAAADREGAAARAAASRAAGRRDGRVRLARTRPRRRARSRRGKGRARCADRAALRSASAPTGTAAAASARPRRGPGAAPGAMHAARARRRSFRFDRPNLAAKPACALGRPPREERPQRHGSCARARHGGGDPARRSSRAYPA